MCHIRWTAADKFHQVMNAGHSEALSVPPLLLASSIFACTCQGPYKTVKDTYKTVKGTDKTVKGTNKTVKGACKTVKDA